MKIPQGGYRVFRSIGSATVLALLTCAAFTASCQASPPPNPQSTEVKSISEPPALPIEVKIISMPPATPTEVKIVATPENASEHALVTATWWLLCANMSLCIVTSAVGWKQSRDMKTSIGVSTQAANAASTSADAAGRSAVAAKESVEVTNRQERAGIQRELNRAAHKVMGTATRLDQLAQAVPAARIQLHVLAGQGGMPPQIKEETEKTLQDRRTRMREISAVANDITMSDLASMSDQLLTSKLWRLDEYQMQLDVMREAITDELTRYENESLTRRQQQTAMRAAALNAQLTPVPPKTTLG